MRNQLELDTVCFSYDKSGDVVHGMSWRVQDGDVVGVHGPNGCGKTTVLDLLCGILEPRSGRVLLGGKDVRARSRSISRIDADFDMFDYLTLEQNVQFFLRFYGRAFEPSAAHLLFERYHLASARTQLAAHASRGMRRKTQIITAVLQAPGLLIADEPLDGLDEQAQASWIEDVRLLSRKGTIVVQTLHDIQRLREHADYILELPIGSLSRATEPGQRRAMLEAV